MVSIFKFLPILLLFSCSTVPEIQYFNSIYINNKCGKVMGTLYNGKDLSYRIVFNNEIITIEEKVLNKMITTREVIMNSDLCKDK